MREISTVGVAGAGTMGSGIAIVAARAGFNTVLFDENDAALQNARKGTEKFFARSVERGKLGADEVEAILARLSYTASIDDLSAADVVIEAIFEELTAKQALLARLDAVCSSDTIFASNTSTIAITEIAAGSQRPGQVVGMHFCLPAQLMKLVEMSPGLETDPDVFDRAWAFCEALGQQPVKTRDTPGFVLNYFLVPFNNDVIRLVESGVAEPVAIDKAIKSGMGYRMGPCELLDLIGLDTQILLCDAFYRVTNDPRASVPPLLRRMVAAGQLGRKTGKGFYNYEGNAMYGS